MDIRTLKLELLERIALLEDEPRLLAVKRLLDNPRNYGIPNERLSVVREAAGTYLPITDRTYSAEEVRDLLEKARLHWEERARYAGLPEEEV